MRPRTLVPMVWLAVGLLACATIDSMPSPGVCTPQLEPGDGSAELQVRIEATGVVSEATILEATTMDGFGALARKRALQSIYPKREKSSVSKKTTRFSNIRDGDRIVVATPVSITETAFTEEDFRIASEEGSQLWACGRFQVRLAVEKVVCATSVERQFVVQGGLGHSTCDSGMTLDRQYLVWTERDGDGWWVKGAYPLVRTRDSDFAMTAWDAQELLLDRLEREIPELVKEAPPYFWIPFEGQYRENLELYQADHRYEVRSGAVYPRTGVLVSEAANALRSGP